WTQPTTRTRVPDGLPTSIARIGRPCHERPSSVVRPAGAAVVTSAASMRMAATFTSGHGEPETSRARERVTRRRVEEAQAVRAHTEADRVAAYSVEAGVEP